jgi:HSP20 family molecular chaperone IbpA
MMTTNCPGDPVDWSKLFKDSMHPPTSFSFKTKEDRDVIHDLSTDGDSAILTLGVPGAKREEITVEVKATRVFVTYKAKNKKNSLLPDFEKSYVVLDSDFNTDKATSKLADGVLTVTIPKVQTKSISID